MMCEKCWADAYLRHINNPQKSQADHYRDLLEERRELPYDSEGQCGTLQTVQGGEVEQ